MSHNIKKIILRKMMAVYFFIPLSLVAFGTKAKGQDLKKDDFFATEHLDEQVWHSGLCYAKNVVISPNGQFVLFLSKEANPNIGGLETYSGSTVDLLEWPSNDSSLVRGARIDINARTLAISKSNKIIVGTLFNKINIFKQNDAGKFDLTNTWKRPNTAKTIFPEDYLNIIKWDDDAQDKIINSIISPEMRNNEFDRYFKETKAYDGLVSRSILGNEIYDIGSKDGRKLMVRNEGDQIWKINDDIDAYGFSDLSIIEAYDAKKYLSGMGLIIPFNSKGFEKPIDTNFYSKTLNTQSTGFTGVIYNPNNIISLNHKYSSLSKKLQKVVDLWKEKGWYLQSAAYEETNNKSVLLFRGFTEFDAAIVFINNKQVLSYKCDREIGEYTDIEIKNIRNGLENLISEQNLRQSLGYKDIFHPPLKLETIPTPKYKTSFSQIGPKNHQIGKWTIAPNVPSKGNIIYIRGGSAFNLRNLKITELEDKLLSDGWEINAYEYSGAINTNYEVFTRLRRNRDKALKEDAEIIQKDVLYKNNNRPIILLNDSFGATLSSYLVENMDNKINASFFIVPFGHWVPSLSKRQRLLDRNSYGGPIDDTRSDINMWLDARKKIVCNSSKANIFFGRSDHIVKPDDWLSTCGSKMNYKIFDDASHSRSKSMEDEIYFKSKEIMGLNN